MSKELEAKVTELKVRVYDALEALEGKSKNADELSNVLVKIAQIVDLDPTKGQVTYDQIISAVQALKDAEPKTEAAPVAQAVPAPVEAPVAPVAPDAQ